VVNDPVLTDPTLTGASVQGARQPNEPCPYSLDCVKGSFRAVGRIVEGLQPVAQQVIEFTVPISLTGPRSTKT
jgi:hypothetical protein